MKNELAEVQPLNVVQGTARTKDFLLDGDVFNRIEKFSQIMAAGKSPVPDHLKGSSADCMAVTMQALQWGMNPFAVAQKTFLVSGTLGYEAQLVNAVITSSNAIEGRFHYEYSEQFKDGKDAQAWVRVGAVLKGETEIQWGEKLYPAKQTVKNSPLWITDPKQQSAYLAIKKWARLYAAALILGVYTPDEVEVIATPRDITPKTLNLEELTDQSSVVNEVEENDADLTEVLDAITAAKNKEDLAKAAEKAKLLSEANQLKARPAYQDKLKELKKKPAKVNPAKHSESFERLSKGIEMASGVSDLDAVVGMEDWGNLNKDEAPELQKLIATKREEFSGASADGLFSKE